MTNRILRAAAAALLLLTLGGATVLAGGWATIAADDAIPPVPRAGEDVEYGFTVLQHGVTPAGFEDANPAPDEHGNRRDVRRTGRAEWCRGPLRRAVHLPERGHLDLRHRAAATWVETQPVTGTVLDAEARRRRPPTSPCSAW